MIETTMLKASCEQDDPILHTGSQKVRYLKTQHDLMAKLSQNHLAKAGLAQGQIVFDVGCRIGLMTAYMAHQVGPKGHVYAIDNSRENLTAAQEHIEILGLKNVTFVQADISNLAGPFAFLNNSFSEKNIIHLKDLKPDIVYGRLVLMNTPKAWQVIKDIYNLLKPGGLIAFQESTVSKTEASMDYEALKSYTQACVNLGKQKGVDYDLGEKLEGYLAQAGFEAIEAYNDRAVISGKTAKNFMAISTANWRQEAVNAGVLTHQDFDRFLEVTYKYLEDPTFQILCSQQTFIIGKKTTHD